MNSPRPNLAQVQRWMQAVVTHPAGVEAGMRSADAQAAIAIDPADLELIITRSRHCTSLERLTVYAHAYHARLLECLRELFPAVAAAVGEEAFQQFGFGYLQAYPPRSYTLGRLGEMFTQFLEQTRPPALGASETGSPAPDWPAFVIELARLEWNIDQVYDGPGCEHEPLTIEDSLNALEPDQWPQARLVAAPCVRLLEFRVPVNDWYTAFRHGETTPFPRPEDAFLVLTRRDYVVRRILLIRPQFNLLKDLVAGVTVGEAIERLTNSPENAAIAPHDIAQWFALWAAEGVFLRVELLPVQE